MRSFSVLALSFLTGYQSASTLSGGIDGPQVAGSPPSLKQPCEGVSDVPAGLNGEQVARLWTSDRAKLGTCRRRHKALVDAVGELERQFEPPW